ncbi:MAG: hypothetical protein H0W68_06095 [Gemmatimonadaceae bacterium]|nr:hypothetical protein [Gemmatimonadaceae bacterium]
MRFTQSRTALLATVVTLGAALPAGAQKGHGGDGPKSHAMPGMEMKHDDAGRADRAVQEQARRDTRHADKMADKMEDKTRKEARKAAKATEKRENKAEKALDRTEHHALDAARHADKHALHGIRLTSAQRAQIRAIDKKYDAQLRDLEKQDRAGEKAGRPDDPALVQRIDAIRDQERAELRALLTAAQLPAFDRNVTVRVRH